MDLESAFATIFAAFGSSAALCVVAKLFANTIATGMIKKYELVNQTKLELQKTEYQKEIENLKSQLSQLQKEHEVTFTSLLSIKFEVRHFLKMCMNILQWCSIPKSFAWARI